MTSVGFDPVAFKNQQRGTWDAISAGWQSEQAAFERGAAAATARLLELAGIRQGHRVLDVGTGIGEPALTAAGLTGASGQVLGVDLSPRMIEAARARGAGVPGLEFQVGDVDSLELPAAGFDAVLSRWGLMFAVDRVAAFRSLGRVLAPGGVLAAAVWSAPEQAPMMSLGFRALAERLDMPPPPPGMPGPFSMSDPEQVAGELVAAGFTEVSVTEGDLRFPFRSGDEYVAFNKAVTPPSMKAALAEKFGSDDDPETWAAVRSATEPYASPDGSVVLPAKTRYLRAVRPR
ncbi:methyltransferase type 11 [Actinosynnema sp. ALI-1.44]|uniref:class I SAM-dependent methyltransferase n=1 Tax=Actinosynnema sp. ALI-1.44 TaxID=1933779 RepID=UPI00097BCD78|nr:class I SAM-dependent methyltransferase [Actinosynnema sp. ALI-1.44]ONI76330.1 methyltransferase type 11 [Actinosynnema sp. ALI-1.44]